MSILFSFLIKMIQYLIIIAIAALGNPLYCGPGVPILTRIPNEIGTYTVAYQCLCPIDYFGMSCRNHRRVSCYLTTKDISPPVIDSSNFAEQKTFDVTFSAECYLEQSNYQSISFISFFIKKEMNPQSYKYQLEFGDESAEIIWANDTQLLTPEGFAKYQEGYEYTLDQSGQKRLSKKDEQAIFYGNGPYIFNYSSQFLGFPLTNSHFYVNSTIYKILQESHPLPRQELSFINYENYTDSLKNALQKQTEAQKLIGNFSLSNITFTNIGELVNQFTNFSKDVSEISKLQVVPLIQASMKVRLASEAELGMLKAQLFIEEYYNNRSIRRTSINTATARIPIRVSGIGEATIYNSNFYKAPSRIIYLFLLAFILGLIYLGYKFYKKQVAKKFRMAQMKVQSQFEVNGDNQ